MGFFVEFGFEKRILRVGYFVKSILLKSNM